MTAPRQSLCLRIPNRLSAWLGINAAAMLRFLSQDRNGQALASLSPQEQEATAKILTQPECQQPDKASPVIALLAQKHHTVAKFLILLACPSDRISESSPSRWGYVLPPAASSSAPSSLSCSASVSLPSGLSPSACGSSTCSSTIGAAAIIRCSRAASSASVMSLRRFVIASVER